MTTIFWRLCRTWSRRSSCGCWSSSTPSACKSRYSVVRSLEILLRFAGGGPSFSVVVLDSMPSGAGDPLLEVCCDAGGEGYGAARAREEYSISRMSSGGGEGDRLASELSGDEGGDGEESALGSDDRSEEESESIVPVVPVVREGAGWWRKARAEPGQGRMSGWVSRLRLWHSLDGDNSNARRGRVRTRRAGGDNSTTAAHSCGGGELASPPTT